MVFNLLMVLILSLPFLLVLLLIIIIRKRKKREALVLGEVSLLPFWATVKGSYRLAWKYRMEYLRISWCWLAVAAPVLFIYDYLTWHFLGVSFCSDFHQLRMEASAHLTRFFVVGLLQTALKLLLGVSIAVAWHRLILRNEKVPRHYLRFDRVVWDYFMVALFIFFLEQLPALVNLIIHDMPIMSFVSLAVSIISLFIAVRISVLLPARALGVQQITVKETLQRTRSNFWRLFWGQILCALCILPFLPLFFLIKTAGCGSDMIGALASTVNILLYMLIIPPVFLSFLSLSYQHFFEKDLLPIKENGIEL